MDERPGRGYSESGQGGLGDAVVDDAGAVDDAGERGQGVRLDLRRTQDVSHLDPADHERVFRIFERLGTSAEYPGTGIGLAIVQKAMERMGGKVGFESELNKGSRFWIELPKA